MNGCACGCEEGGVHRVRCKVWLDEPRSAGSQQCQNCPKLTNNTSNGLCGVCQYWHEKAALAERDRLREPEDRAWFERMKSMLGEKA